MSPNQSTETTISTPVDEDLAELLDGYLATMPFSVATGIRLRSAASDEVCGELEWAEDRCTIGGAMHGGAFMALADSVGAICAFLNLPDGGRGTTTIESKTNFFRALTEGTAHATATPLHAGRRTIVVVTDITNDDGKLVVRTTQTQAVL